LAAATFLTSPLLYLPRKQETTYIQFRWVLQQRRRTRCHFLRVFRTLRIYCQTHGSYRRDL